MISPLLPHPAAAIKTGKTRTLVIADLHIGWEMALSRDGIHVPTQTPRILRKLTSIIDECEPERLLILGDVKHTVATAGMAEWRDVPEFFDDLKKQVQEIGVIRGNHDGNLEPLLPENITLLPATGTILGDVGFFHGHRWPSPALLKCKTLVMGHVHPTITLRDRAGFRITRQVWVKAACNRTQLARVLLEKHKLRIGKNPEETLLTHYGIKPRTLQLFIMPSFNEYLGGKPLNERRFAGEAKARMSAGPMLRLEAVDMEKAETYLLDGTLLGTLNQLRS